MHPNPAGFGQWALKMRLSKQLSLTYLLVDYPSPTFLLLLRIPTPSHPGLMLLGVIPASHRGHIGH
jgi:hypothetical protein